MSKKTLVALFLGMVSAGLVCLLFGIIVHFTVKSDILLYGISLFAMVLGAGLAGVGLIILAVYLIIEAIKKNKNN